MSIKPVAVNVTKSLQHNKYSVITVLGMHRCGTSALTRVLNLLGPQLPDNLLVADSNNSKGYWEPKSAVRINDTILDTYDRLWGDPKPLPPGWTNGLKKQSFTNEVEKFLNAEYQTNTDKLVKDPRSSRTFPVWRDAILKTGHLPVCLIAYRNPVEVCQSLINRNNVTAEHGFHLWLTYILEAEHYTRGCRRAFVDYKDLLSDWKTVIREIDEQTGLKLSDNAGLSTDAINEFLDNSLNHQHSASLESIGVNVAAMSNKLYSTLNTGITDFNEFDHLKDQWHQLWLDLSPDYRASEFAQALPDWHRHQSMKQLESGNLDSALFYAGQAVLRDTQSGNARFHLGNLMFKAKRYNEALQHYIKATQFEPDNILYKTATARALICSNDIEGAETILHLAKTISPEDTSVHRLMADCFEQRGDLQEAEACLARAVALDPRQAGDIARIADILWRQERSNEAILQLRKAIALTPTDFTLHSILGHWLSEAGCIRQSVKSLYNALDLKPDSVSVLLQLSKLLQKLDRIDEAVSALNKAITLDSTLHHEIIHLGLLAKENHMPEVAVSAFQKVIDTVPANPHYHYLLGDTLYQNGRFNEALDAVNASIALNPNSLLYHKLHCHILIELDRLPESAKSLQQAVKLASHSLNASTLLEQSSLPIDQVKVMLANLESSLETKALISVFSGYAARSWSAQRIEDNNTIQECSDIRLPQLTVVSKQNDATSVGITPILSIMIPVYNVRSSKWLKSCIDSILSQDEGLEWAEIIIVDDASTNDIASSVAKKYAPRVSYRKNEINLGILKNHNYCIELAQGEYIHILHQDDKVEPGFYKALLKPLSKNKELLAGFTRPRVINMHNKIQKTYIPEQLTAGPLDKFLTRLTIRQRILFPSIIVRKDAYERLGGFSPSLIFAFDWEMWARLAAHGPIWYEPQPLALYRAHAHSETQNIDAPSRFDDCFKTILMMLQRIPDTHKTEIAFHAFYEILHGAWWQAMIANSHPEDHPSREALIEHLLEAWTVAKSVENTQDSLADPAALHS